MQSENLKGIVTMVSAVAAFAIMDAMLKLLAGHYPPMQVSFLRGAASLPFILLPILLRGRLSRLRIVNLRVHLLRGALSVIMLTSFIYAVRESSLAMTYSIFMFAPLLIVSLAIPMLGEKVSRGQWLAVAIGLAGVLLMLRPRAGGLVSPGALAAVVAMLSYSIAVLSLRILARTDTTESMVFYFTAFLALGAGLLALPGWVGLRADDAWLILGVGVAGTAGQQLITEAFRAAPASVVAPFEYTALLWGVLLDLAIWGVLPGVTTIAGGSIVAGAGLYLIARERRRR
jgi:drug/metabolite transporter (DMT)-like permease